MSKKPFTPDFSPLDYDKLNQPLSEIEQKKSAFERRLYEMKSIARTCRVIDNSEDEEERAGVIILHDLLLERIEYLEKLVGQL